jgi:hypothetical protein
MYFTNLPPRRVLIVGNDLLFEEGLTKLLTTGTSLSVTGAKYIDEDTAFLEDVLQQRPDVILLNEESKTLEPARVLELLLSIPSLAGWRIIIVRPNNNAIDVYDFPYSSLLRKLHKRRQFIVAKREDLIDIIHGDFTKQVDLQISNQSPI